MVLTTQQLQELGSSSEITTARQLVERKLGGQGISLSEQTAGTRRVFQVLFSEAEIGGRLPSASGVISIGEAAARRRGVTFVGGTAQTTPAFTGAPIERFLVSDVELAKLSPEQIRVAAQTTTRRLGRTTVQQLIEAPPTPQQPMERESLFRKGVSAAKEFAFGETGKQFVGFDIAPRFTPFRKRDITIQEIRKVSEQELGFGGAVFSTLLRGVETPGGVAITGGLVGATILAPPIVGTFITTGVTGLGIRGALDPGLAPPERVASGIIAVGGGVGLVTTGIPFVRGIGAKGVKVAPEGFEIIPGVRGFGDIGLIQPGKGARVGVDLPKESPLVRGGFGRIPGGEQRFIGEDQFLTTSQRGFFEVGKEIPIEREFFVTPQEPFIGIAETRISRLGLTEFFKVPKEVEIGFGIPPTPQIGITRGAVGRVERLGVFEIGKGTELEAIKTTGIITDIGKIGRARIKGRGVDIFEFRTEVGRIGRGRIRDRGLDFRTTEVTTRVPGETLISSIFRRPTRGISRPTRDIISLGIPTISIGISPPTTFPISPGISPPSFAPPISPPISPGISPPTIPPFFPPTPPTRDGFDFEPPRPARRLRGRAERKRKPKKLKKLKRRKTKIAPSFTAIVARLKGGLPEIKTIGGIEIGILPTKLRRL